MKRIVTQWSHKVFGWKLLFSCICLSGWLACQTTKENKEDDLVMNFMADSVYVNRGSKLVALTFDTLRNSLIGAMEAQGVTGAISFCNERAYAITATYADSVLIRRTSLRVRNPANRPDSLELIVLNEMARLNTLSGSPTVKVIKNKTTGEVHFFKPIMLQSMCLSCHGSSSNQISGDALAKIETLYPKDQAVNFREGDLRGVWHLTFKRK